MTTKKTATKTSTAAADRRFGFVTECDPFYLDNLYTKAEAIKNVKKWAADDDAYIVEIIGKIPASKKKGLENIPEL